MQIMPFFFLWHLFYIMDFLFHFLLTYNSTAIKFSWKKSSFSPIFGFDKPEQEPMTAWGRRAWVERDSRHWECQNYVCMLPSQETLLVKRALAQWLGMRLCILTTEFNS